MGALERTLFIAGKAILVVAVAAVGYWGYQEHQDKNSVLIKAENNYQRAFHDLNNNIGNLEDELGKSIAMNSRHLMAPCMANIWRLTYVAQNNVGQLPLNLMAFSKTEQFLAEIADYTFDIGMRDVDAEPLSDEEWNRLKTLHSQAKEIQGELRKIQTEVLDKNLRWMDVEVALASENVDMDSTIVAGFAGLEEQVQGYIEAEGNVTDNENLFQSPEIEGEEVSAEEAKEKVKQFFDLSGDAEITVSESEEDQVAIYSMHIKQNTNSDNVVACDVSKNGGHVLWFLNSKDIEDTRIGLYDAQTKALEFLEAQGIGEVEVVESNQYDNVGVFEIVPVQENVRLYPEVITVKVALDEGDIIGYQATNYLINNKKDRNFQAAKIQAADAKQRVNGNLNIMEEHLAVIEQENNEYILCYELLGTIGDETYRIFVNAETGNEERIEKMKQAQPL